MHMYLLTQSDPRETSGPRNDRIPQSRPSWRDRQYRELKKLIFPAPRKCPIDLFGPVANGRILKRLQSRFGCMLVTYRPLAACEARHNDGAELKYQSIIHCEHQSGHTATRSQRNDLNGVVCVHQTQRCTTAAHCSSCVTAPKTKCSLIR